MKLNSETLAMIGCMVCAAIIGALIGLGWA